MGPSGELARTISYGDDDILSGRLRDKGRETREHEMEG